MTCLVEHDLALPYFNGKRKNDSQIAHSKVDMYRVWLMYYRKSSCSKRFFDITMGCSLVGLCCIRSLQNGQGSILSQA